MSNQLLELVPAIPPDIGQLDDAVRRSAALWLPTPTQAGQVITLECRGRPLGDLSTLYDDVESVVPILQAPAFLGHFYNYLGVKYERVAEDGRTATRISLPHGTTLNSRLTALPVPPEHRPPPFTIWEGDDFPAEAGAREIREHGAFLMAGEGEEVVHDLLVHLISGQVFLRGTDMNSLRERSRQTDPVRLMRDVDRYASYLHIGTLVAEAFRVEEGVKTAEETAANPRLQLRNNLRIDHSMDWWARAVWSISNLTDRYMDDQLAAAEAWDFRHHCLVLCMAALERCSEELAASAV